MFKKNKVSIVLKKINVYDHLVNFTNVLYPQ